MVRSGVGTAISVQSHILSFHDYGVGVLVGVVVGLAAGVAVAGGVVGLVVGVAVVGGVIDDVVGLAAGVAVGVVGVPAVGVTPGLPLLPPVVVAPFVKVAPMTTPLPSVWSVIGFAMLIRFPQLRSVKDWLKRIARKVNSELAAAGAGDVPLTVSV